MSWQTEHEWQEERQIWIIMFLIIIFGSILLATLDGCSKPGSERPQVAPEQVD